MCFSWCLPKPKSWDCSRPSNIPAPWVLLILSAGADQHTISEHRDFGFLFKQGHCKGPSTVSPVSQFLSRELWMVLTPLSHGEESAGWQDGSRVTLAVVWSCRSLTNLFDSVWLFPKGPFEWPGVCTPRKAPALLQEAELGCVGALVHRLLHRSAPALVGSHWIYGSGHCF